ncbi:MAG: hypothetical protein GHCLOJNM_04219 [bacterium]|nr:hypothetical protein [bacterium]
MTLDVSAYQQNGFLVLEGLISPEELEELRRDAIRICRGEYPCEQIEPLPADLTDEEAISRFLCIHQPHKLSPVMRRAVAHPRIAEVLSRLIGPNVKCMQSMLFIKPPRHPGQAWHQDEFYIPTRDRSLTGGWIALDEATIENGCLWVIPGSHRTGYLWPQRDHGNPREFDWAGESHGFDEGTALPVECPAGTVVFFNGYLLHRSLKNRSKRFRRVLVNHYMNAFSLLPWHARTEDGVHCAAADFRDVVLVAGQDPYGWKGVEEKMDIFIRPFDPSALMED